MGLLTFHIYAAGDPTVGDGDHHAEVTILNTALARDADYVRACSESLRDAFALIFDNRRVSVSPVIGEDT